MPLVEPRVGEKSKSLALDRTAPPRASRSAAQRSTAISTTEWQEPEQLGGSRPVVSVIVIGRNEGERLSRCLHSIRAIDFPPERLELIYVDSGSSDDSVGRAREQRVHIVVLPAGPTTAGRGRNAGYRVARGEFLFFLDGDTIVAPEFLKRALMFLQAHPDVAVYWGHRRELYPRRSLYNRVIDLEWVVRCGESTFCGGDAVMRKRVLDDVGPFCDDLIAGEEPELCTRIRRAGCRIWHADEPMTQHDVAVTRFSAYWRRCYRGGHAYAEVADRTQGMLFKRESIKNHLQMAVYLLTPIGLILAFGWPGLWVAIATAGLAVVRTAWRNRWRKASVSTTLLFAVIHAHFAQLPVWLGQVAYLCARRRPGARQIIEYK